MIRKLMLIDNDEAFRMLFKSNLEARGSFAVVATPDAENAVTLAKVVSPDLILLNVLIPEMDGLAAADKLRRDNFTKKIPVAFLTSLETADDAKKMHEKLGNLYLLSKSATTEELVESIEEILLKCSQKTRG